MLALFNHCIYGLTSKAPSIEPRLSLLFLAAKFILLIRLLNWKMQVCLIKMQSLFQLNNHPLSPPMGAPMFR
jgi:hypothetical protein